MRNRQKDLQQLPILTEEEWSQLSKVGFQTQDRRSGSFLLSDQEILCSFAHSDRLEVLPLQRALIVYPWVQDLLFRLIDPDENPYTKLVAEQVGPPVGHFIRVFEDQKVSLPVQACMMLRTPQARQYVHNITIVEKNAELELITGATVEPHVHTGRHICLGEYYIADGGTLRTTTIERWESHLEVHCFEALQIGKNAKRLLTHLLLTPVKIYESDPKSLIDENGCLQERSVIFAPPGSSFRLGGRAYLQGTGASAELISRAVSAGGRIATTPTIVGQAKGAKGFAGCDGLQLTEEGEIVAIPKLEATTTGLQLSHEASVGAIAQEKLSYLMASGMSEEEARDLIIQGFLALKEGDIPKEISQSVRDAIAAAKSGGM